MVQLGACPLNGNDHVDLFQLHNPLTAQDAGDKLAIDIALEQVAPAMEKLKASGKTRFIGFSGVGEPAALLRAVESKLFDTVQVVYNALNPSAGGPMRGRCAWAGLWPPARPRQKAAEHGHHYHPCPGWRRA